jgi:hypothetical protein
MFVGCPTYQEASATNNGRSRSGRLQDGGRSGLGPTQVAKCRDTKMIPEKTRGEKEESGNHKRRN